MCCLHTQHSLGLLELAFAVQLMMPTLEGAAARSGAYPPLSLCLLTCYKPSPIQDCSHMARETGFTRKSPTMKRSLCILVMSFGCHAKRLSSGQLKRQKLFLCSGSWASRVRESARSASSETSSLGLQTADVLLHCPYITEKGITSSLLFLYSYHPHTQDHP